MFFLSGLSVSASKIIAFSSPGQVTPGQQHRHALLVAAVFVSEGLDQIAFFQENSDEDVGRGHRGEQQMPSAHGGSRPKRDDKAQIDRVSHEFEKQRRPETRRRRLETGEIVDDLVQSKQLEMVDQESAAQRDQ